MSFSTSVLCAFCDQFGPQPISTNADFRGRASVASKAVILTMVLFSLRNVSEGDVPRYLYSAGNTIKSELIEASSLPPVHSYNAALEITRFYDPVADPCVFEDGKTLISPSAGETMRKDGYIIKRF